MVGVYERDRLPHPTFLQCIESWEEWYEGYGKRLVEDLRQARLKRCEDIQTKMKDLGWNRKVLQDSRFQAQTRQPSEAFD
ncbi:hypothetical protein PM082_019996 [Marasmius tenuissimus]|nr:hypothetical protein PM082_019996 [Marasmius tenuissimus]